MVLTHFRISPEKRSFLHFLVTRSSTCLKSLWNLSPLIIIYIMQYAMNAVLKMRMILEISRQRDGNPVSLLITLNAYFSQAIFFLCWRKTEIKELNLERPGSSKGKKRLQVTQKGPRHYCFFTNVSKYAIISRGIVDLKASQFSKAENR